MSIEDRLKRLEMYNSYLEARGIKEEEENETVG